MKRSLMCAACAVLVACGGSSADGPADGAAAAPGAATPASAPVPSAPAPVPGTVTFFSGWETGMTGAGKDLWRYVQRVAPDRMQIVGSPVRQGTAALRIEVRPGDDPLHPGAPGNERAEVMTMNLKGQPLNENEASGTQYFALSVRLDAHWQSPEPNDGGYKWGSVLQLHGPDSIKTSPAFSLDVVDRFRITLHTGDLEQPTNPMKWRIFDLSDSRLNAGAWVDFVVRIVFDKGPHGAVTVWRRDEGAAAFTRVFEMSGIPTLQYATSEGRVGDHYWKHGYYRTQQRRVVNVLWLDGMTRASTFEAAAQAAFGDR